MTQLRLAFLTVVLGCLLLIAGFIAPPMGEISPSVLTAFGECLTFAGALCGIDFHYRNKDNNQSN